MDLYVVNFIFKNSIIEHILIVFIVLITSTEHVLQFSFFRHKIQKKNTRCVFKFKIQSQQNTILIFIFVLRNYQLKNITECDLDFL